MRFERLVVEGFGPIAGETVDFAPGMTVVFGPNESAKSTLHAALYAALCGMRRARGQPRVEDREFAARHRPWGGEPWRVQAHLRLEDGRLIELWHDLDGRVDCRAVDTGLGRDVSNEIMFEGAPDGSRWLGFDRGSFVATACVRQTAIAAVLENANALQDELQRAATSAGRDETAANAIERLKSFSSEKVGLDRANSTKPLRRAITGVARTQETLDDAQQRHDGYLTALVGVAEREAACDTQRRLLRRAEAVVARVTANKAQKVAERASELAGKYPREPEGSAGHGQLGDTVAEALARWDGCPPEPDLSGETVEAIEAQLAQLPERPEGDLSPAHTVLDAETVLKASVEVLDQHQPQKPIAGAEVRLPADAAELERLAAALDADAPRVDPELRQRVSTLRGRVRSAHRSLPRLPLALAAILAVVGVVASAAVAPAVGIAVLVVAAVVAGMTLWLGRQRADIAAGEALATAQRMLDDQQSEVDSAVTRRAEAIERLQTLGLRAEPDAIRALVTEAATATSATAAFDVWEVEQTRRARAHDAAVEALRAALLERQAEGGEDVKVSVSEYKAACDARERQEREANRRPGIEQRLATRRIAEADAAARADARERLLAAAAQAGVEADEAATAAQALREWQGRKQEELVEHDVATREWTELKQLLGDRSLDELKAESVQTGARADSLAVGFAENELASPASEAQAIPSLRQELERFDSDAAFARGDVERMAKDVPSVPEAEERLAAAEAELERVRVLQDVLDRTIEFLEAAQDRVHRTIAPVLQGTLREWLPRVVVSRDGATLVECYDDVTIDPESLRVQVRRDGGPWRNAALLSEGTKEQIFLLLRVALAEHLTKQGERAPLILDEITAQCDSDRRVALLDLVHELSAERQVILFTHDEGALAWAQERLNVESGTDRLELREALVAGGV